MRELISGETVSLLFEPRDLWVGAYWRIEGATLVIFICIIPTLPVRITLGRF